MSTGSKRIGKNAAKMMQDVQELNDTVRDTAFDKLGQLGKKASEYFEQGQDKANGFACASENFVRQRPLTSVLVAVGIGWLLGRFWKRR